ncbi:MAG: hypothetical protein KJO79_06865, partial [Verrucomicrobiae bacterium]|nr:hypothetical protein [Verrucomicrobiae bacterium]NNJ86882.1 hypothetical protein [Akkermansiaceae bacterium]
MAACLTLLCSFTSCRQVSEIDRGASGQALLDAVKAGDNRKAAVLLTEGVYTEVRDQRGNTPFL